jgi:GGDEF domain-containing protein
MSHRRPHRRTAPAQRGESESYRQAVSALTMAAGIIPAAVGSSSRGTVVVLDLVSMHGINERHGVTAGDRLLEAIAVSLRSVREQAVVARLAGDQFIVVVPGDTRSAAVEEAVLVAVRRTRVRGGWWRAVRTTARTGRAEWHDEVGRHTVVAAAGVALAAARRMR